MVTVTSGPERDDPEILPVMRWWLDRLDERLEHEGRGAPMRLCEAIKCSSGQLADLRKRDDDGNPVSKTSWMVRAIDRHYKWPPMMPLSPDTAELQHLLDGLDVDAKELLAQIRSLPKEEQRAMVGLIMARKKTEP